MVNATYTPTHLYPLHCLGVLRSVLDAAVEGCNVLTLCEMGDRLILEETSKVYKREKEMKKGDTIQRVISQHCTYHPLSPSL